MAHDTQAIAIPPGPDKDGQAQGARGSREHACALG
jgi:hypothetical protein